MDLDSRLWQQGSLLNAVISKVFPPIEWVSTKGKRKKKKRKR
jgi:hypothetical protein